jgi:large subunit ribosomal protein L1
MSVVVGKRSFTSEQLLDNMRAALDVIGKSRPDGFKGRFIKNVSLSSTMSAGVRIDQAVFSSF